MMRELIRWAKANGFKDVWGFITPHDGSTLEYLQDWYKHQGFRVYEAKPGMFHILLDLQGTAK